MLKQIKAMTKQSAPAAPQAAPAQKPPRPDTSHMRTYLGAQAQKNREARRMPYMVRVIFALTALAFGVPLWMIGARFTRDGWYVWLNLFFDWIGIPYRLEITTAAMNVATLFAFGLVYSVVEQSWRFVGWLRNTRVLAGLRTWQVLAIFAALTAAVVITDVGSTATGLYQSTVGSESAAGVLIREYIIVRIVVSGMLTYAPDWAILFAIGLLLPRFIKRIFTPQEDAA